MSVLFRSKNGKAVAVEVDSQTEEEDATALVNDDTMFHAPSGLDANALPPPVSTRSTSKACRLGTDNVRKVALTSETLSSSATSGPVSAPVTLEMVVSLINGMLANRAPSSDSSRAVGGVVGLQEHQTSVGLARDGSPSPEVDDPIDYNTVAMLQVLTDAASSVRKDQLETGVTDSRTEIPLAVMGIPSGPAAASLNAASPGRPLDEADTFSKKSGAAVQAMIKQGKKASRTAESDAFMKKVAAPYDLAAMKALKINNYLEKPLVESPACDYSPGEPARPLVPVDERASCQCAGVVGKVSSGSTAVASSGRRTLAEVLGRTKESVAASSEVYLSDLETYKATYDPEAVCGVYDEELQDEVLKSTYSGLPPLPGGTALLPAFRKQGDNFEYTLPGGRVSFSLWPDKIPSIDYDNSVGAVTFEFAPGGFLNPSRFDPRRIGIQSTTADSSRYILVADDKPAICVSAVMAAESVLREGQSIGKAMPRKWLTALFHNQEYERFVSLMCLAFNTTCVYGQLAHGGVVFQTRMGSSKGAGAFSSIDKSGLVSPQKGFKASAPGEFKSALNFEDKVPIYDARSVRFDYQTDFSRLSSLPPFPGEIPFGSFVVVGYTVTGWNAVPAVNADGFKHPHLGCNILWAVVFGVPEHVSGV
ncbi:hypothetical protein C8J57DRAFT_1541939 [Mycena rebaudengoi]|nr:hypothetical protein C8J57DRAFT_1541939 [Mycena rebaudengoi]